MVYLFFRCAGVVRCQLSDHRPVQQGSMEGFTYCSACESAKPPDAHHCRQAWPCRKMHACMLSQSRHADADCGRCCHLASSTEDASCAPGNLPSCSVFAIAARVARASMGWTTIAHSLVRLRCCLHVATSELLVLHHNIPPSPTEPCLLDNFCVRRKQAAAWERATGAGSCCCFTGRLWHAPTSPSWHRSCCGGGGTL